MDSSCQLNGENLAVKITTDFEGQAGPMARASTADQPTFSYPWFVAVTDESGQILSKDVFATTFTFPAGHNTLGQEEYLRQLIPLNDNGQAGNYTILLGFQLDEDQLAYNRMKMAADIQPAAGNGIVTERMNPQEPPRQ